MSKYTFIDLFAGCGGLSEGFYMQDFEALAHVEIDHAACKTLKKRMEHYGYKSAEKNVLELDITSDDVIDRINGAIEDKDVDVIIGGPPCQSFSSLGRAKDENGMKDDPRNFLFESYVKILNYYKPKFFVFENVTGLLTAKIKNKHIVSTIINKLSENYKVTTKPAEHVLNSANYGVPQIRKRVILIGVRKDIPIEVEEVYNSIIKTHYDPEMSENDRGNLKKYVTVEDAIKELPLLKAGEGERVIEFKYKKDNDFLKRIASDKNILLDHVARKHNEIDIERYREMSKNHWTFQELLGHRADLHHTKQRLFGNSYAVQWWNLPSKTIIAHLYKDGNQFIHPDYEQARTLTVREVARLQSFSDDFVFEGSRTDQYKQIGNAVPPLLAEAIAIAIKAKLKQIEG